MTEFQTIKNLINNYGSAEAKLKCQEIEKCLITTDLSDKKVMLSFKIWFCNESLSCARHHEAQAHASKYHSEYPVFYATKLVNNCINMCKNVDDISLLEICNFYGVVKNYWTHLAEKLLEEP